ncbi:MAG: efflux RND transporter periplasmic adaptor subunit [Candidatus Krumholzibacteriota bacterium]|nr:efflux RND transporter periplasmic adaptor subunit [Candidatus Krumholzibacteriota bacterium]
MKIVSCAKRFLAVVCIVPVIFAVAGCSKEEPLEREPVARPIKTVVVGEDAVTERSFPGLVEASNRVDLSFRVKGPLTELKVTRGMDVKKGFLIARLDPRDYQIALEEAKASFTKADADFRRYQSLYEKDAVSLAELDQRRSQRDVTKARQDDAESNLSYTYLRAPFDGTISDRFVENFEVVAAQQPIVSLENFDMLDILIDLPEHLIATVRDKKDDMSIVATFDAAPGVEYPVTIKAITSQADPATRTYEVRVSMKQPSEINVLTGMTAQVTSKTTVTNTSGGVNVIPAVAVFEDDEGKSCVWVIDEEMTVHKREVVPGEITGVGEIVIEDGLNPGDRVAVAAVAQLREGMKVRLLTD